MQKLGRVSRILEAPLESVSCILMILILALVFSEVVARYIFGQSYGFLEEFSKWSQIWFTYLMLGVIENRRRHIAIDILPRRLSGRYKTLLLIALDIVSLVFCVVLFWSGLEMVLVVKGLGEVTALAIRIPMWIVRLCVPLGAIFLAFFSINNLFTDIHSLAKYKGNKE